MIVGIRRTLAFPFYLVSFILHLLTAFFTVVAQKISGDDFMSSRIADIIATLVICGGCAIALTLWGIRSLEAPAQPPTALALQVPILQWREIPTGFLPEQHVWARPLVRLTACIFAQRAVRHSLGPAAEVGFDPCGEGGRNEITLDDAYYEASVSGRARVNGKYQPFNVALNHYPPSTSEWGFIATDIQIGKPEQMAACSN